MRKKIKRHVFIAHLLVFFLVVLSTQLSLAKEIDPQASPLISDGYGPNIGDDDDDTDLIYFRWSDKSILWFFLSLAIRW